MRVPTKKEEAFLGNVAKKLAVILRDPRSVELILVWKDQGGRSEALPRLFEEIIVANVDHYTPTPGANSIHEIPFLH